MLFIEDFYLFNRHCVDPLTCRSRLSKLQGSYRVVHDGMLLHHGLHSRVSRSLEHLILICEGVLLVIKVERQFVELEFRMWHEGTASTPDFDAVWLLDNRLSEDERLAC